MLLRAMGTFGISQDNLSLHGTEDKMDTDINTPYEESKSTECTSSTVDDCLDAKRPMQYCGLLFMKRISAILTHDDSFQNLDHYFPKKKKKHKKEFGP